ncbi:chemotaxis protein CheW [Methylobacter sp. S3L5C]|uniref:chemotaxis protein CheW n=1 Tax=Methylobacter sp. S3L5C TaxID=2839024 RepID=UPI001FAE5044|nr:chemotaxis protein CheW [Methylobacter sp. S3L5C]UOA09800.1 chemotaxis protein CheW [Methylobacter sp. S3L5C]
MKAMTPIAKSLLTVAGSQNQEEQQQYLTFMLRSETYAISILSIKEIIQHSQLTEVPRMPDFILGVINLRGAVVPVIDLSARFGKRAIQVGRRNCIIIVEVNTGEESQNVGVMVDAVNAVLEIPAHEIEPAPSFGSNIRADFIAGMGKINGKFVIILNIQYVLSMDDMAALVGAGYTSAVELKPVE